MHLIIEKIAVPLKYRRYKKSIKEKRGILNVGF